MKQYLFFTNVSVISVVLGKLDGTFVPVVTWGDYELMSWSAVVSR